LITQDNSQRYTQKYIWNRFKNNSLTLAGILLPSISSISMMSANWPISLQFFNLAALIGMVGTSYWWHWFYKVEDIAKEGALKYLKEQEKERKLKLIQHYEMIDLSYYPTYQKMKLDLQEQFLAFNSALSKQRVISKHIRASFKTKAEQAFETGTKLLAEIADILVIQNSINISEVKIEAIIKSYEHNENNLQKLTKSFQSILHSYMLAITNLATVTSKTNLKEDIFNISELQDAIQAAKTVQTKLHALSYGKEDEMHNIYKKYQKKGVNNNG